jgi:Na+/proline symporter
MVDPAVFPPALAGLMIAAFAAAYMSTIATNLNWGASYLVNDFYRRFLLKGQTDRHYVRIAQLATLLLMVASSVVTYYQDSISGAWKFLMAVGAGTGSVCILRWFWWRINAWSEVSAMTASFVVSMGLQYIGKFDSNDPRQFAWTVLITVAASTVSWLLVTWLTPPEDKQTLLAFYRRVKPSPTLWGVIAREASEVRPRRDEWKNLFDWLAGCAMIYLTLFGIGKIIFGHWRMGLFFLGFAAAAGCFVYWDLNRRGWKVLDDESSNTKP